MLDSKDEMSHYDYIKSIALAWINLEQYWPKKTTKPKKRKVPVETFTIKRGKRRVVESNARACSSKNSKNKEPIIYVTLNPSNGMSSFRLNNSLQHPPKATKSKTSRCQLHIWARGRGGNEVFDSVMT